MFALHDIIAGVEEQECSCPKRALRLAFLETLIADQRALLVTNEPTDWDAFQRTSVNMTIHF